MDKNVVKNLEKTYNKFNTELLNETDKREEKAIPGRVLYYINKDQQAEEPIFIIDIGKVVKQYLRWEDNFPNIRPYYAVKCNNNPALLEVIHAMGGAFDCASKNEVENVMKLGVDPKDIIFANPCKQIKHLQFAKEKGVEMTTFDNEDELYKIKKYWPEAKLVLRIVTDDSASICQFSCKFGASLDVCPKLISVCKELDLDLVGISFHVGSGCGDSAAFVHAALNARKVFNEAEKHGYKLRLLDIGGGFPGDSHSRPTFEEIAEALAPVLEEHFQGVEIIAEPGRYFACGTHTLACQIFARRVQPREEGAVEYLYYINDGVYQSFNCIFFDHATVRPHPLRLTAAPQGPPQARVTTHRSTIFGPTCDALDCIVKGIQMPEMSLGDWIYFPNMGAYTVAAASAFNGFYNWRVEYCSSFDLAPFKDSEEVAVS
jgi:ornithine decarboxylase